jgi:hypothetical protein
MATVADIQGVVSEVQGLSTAAANLVETLDPAVAVPTATAEQLLTVVTELISVGLKALTMAQGMAINATTIASLAPDPTPLTPPTA